MTARYDRQVVSNDYPDMESLKRAHVRAHEAAISAQRRDLILTDPVQLALHRKSDDEVQAMIETATGIIAPPRLRYAFVTPDGRIANIVETRNPNDANLRPVDGYTIIQNDDARLNDTFTAEGVLVPAPFVLEDPAALAGFEAATAHLDVL